MSRGSVFFLALVLIQALQLFPRGAAAVEIKAIRVKGLHSISERELIYLL